MAAKKKKKKTERPIFTSIRKPTAPPTRHLGEEKAEAVIHPARRKEKYKKRDEAEIE